MASPTVLLDLLAAPSIQQPPLSSFLIFYFYFHFHFLFGLTRVTLVVMK